jgi:hypothetical protein
LTFRPLYPDSKNLSRRKLTKLNLSFTIYPMSNIDAMVKQGLEEVILHFSEMMRNADKDTDKNAAAKQFYEVMRENGLLRREQDNIQPINFNPKHFDNIVEGLIHLTQKSNIEDRLPKEHIERAVSFLISPDSLPKESPNG